MDRRNPFLHHQHQLQQQQQQQFHLPPHTMAVDAGGVGGERLPQWGVEETKELLGIREELDQTFMETKRNKLLWEVVAAKMSGKGFVRSAEQCKSKWKNLVTRYKGYETTDPEAIRQQFPFYNEMQTIFTARMERMLWSEAAEPSTSKRKHQLSSEEDEGEEDDYEPDHDIDDELLSLVETQQRGSALVTSTPRKRAKKAKGGASAATATTSSSSGSVKEALEEFMRQMVKMEREWREVYEAKERERERREREWRRRMMELEEERSAAERRWMEREEERRMREEARAQKRDALIDALLTNLNRDHDYQP